MIDVKDTEESRMGQTSSVYNTKSVEYTVALALELVPLFGAEKITILTSYAAQKSLLDKILSTIPELKGIQTSTVRGYLSSQNDIVIYDHAREKDYGFTKSAKHFRVILTRCRAGLFLLYNQTALNAAPKADSMFEEIQQ